MTCCLGCDQRATVLLTLLNSTSVDAAQESCWSCAESVLADWATSDEWADTEGWTVERLRLNDGDDGW